MLVLSTLNGLLSQLVSSQHPHTAILLTPQGHLIACQSTDEDHIADDRVRILTGLSSEVWREGLSSEDEGSDDEGDDEDDEQVGMLECELGRVLVFPIFAAKFAGPQAPPLQEKHPMIDPPPTRIPVLLLALNGTEESPWGLMNAKARTLARYLSKPLAAVGDRVSPGLNPMKLRNGGHIWSR